MSDKNDYTPVPTTQDELQPSKQQDVPDDDVENKSSGDDTQVQSVAQKEIKKEKPPAASFRQLFRFADIFDIFLMLLGTIGAIVQGSVLPIQYLIFGGLSDAFIGYARCPRLNTSDSTNCTRVDIEAELARFSQYYVAIAFCLAVAIVVQLVTWGITAERQVHKIRKAYFKSILRQDMTWFDTFDSGELNTRLTDDLSKIADGMGYKFAMVVQSLAGLISGYTLGFSHGWKLTLVIISVFPLVVMAGGFASSFVTSLSAKEGASYAAAGSIAQEALSSVRTVVAFGGEKKETERMNETSQSFYFQYRSQPRMFWALAPSNTFHNNNLQSVCDFQAPPSSDDSFFNRNGVYLNPSVPATLAMGQNLVISASQNTSSTCYKLNCDTIRQHQTRICTSSVPIISSTQTDLDHPPHSRKKTNIRYYCRFCNKPFCWLSHWKAHERVHTGERPFVCGICNKAFTRSDGLKCHRITHRRPIYLPHNNSQRPTKGPVLPKLLPIKPKQRRFSCFKECNADVVESDGNGIQYSKSKEVLRCEAKEKTLVNERPLDVENKEHRYEQQYPYFFVHGKICKLPISSTSYENYS